MPYAPLDLTGQTAVVIGGTSGIGRVMTRALAEAGADVVATSRRMDVVEDTAKEIESIGRATLRVPSDVTDRASLETVLAQVDRAIRQGRDHDQLRGPHQARAVAGPAGRRLERDPRDEPDGHAARGPGLRPPHGRARLRAHREHRLAQLVRGALRGRGVRREQGGGGGADQAARDRVGVPRRVRQRHRARRVSDTAEPESARRHRPRPRVSGAHAHEALRKAGGAWRARRCSSRHRPPASSPAKCSWSTAASSPAV